jgi:hypothetical protein
MATDAPSPLAAQPLPVPTLNTVLDAEIDNTDLTRAVHHEARANRPDNTEIAYSGKHREFLGYCDAMYAHQARELRHLVTPSKVYNFMFYTAHREKRKPGKPKRGEEREGDFARGDYERVLGKYTGRTTDELVLPLKPLQFQQVNTYKSSIIELHDQQVAEKRNNYIWSHDIWNCHCKNLFNYVKVRRNKTKKANYEEKVDESFSFFKAQGKAAELENEMWKLASNRGLRQAYPAIR